jgi:hypothetical protein
MILKNVKTKLEYDDCDTIKTTIQPQCKTYVQIFRKTRNDLSCLKEDYILAVELYLLPVIILFVRPYGKSRQLRTTVPQLGNIIVKFLLICQMVLGAVMVMIVW